MSEMVGQLCERMRHKLSSLESRMGSLKSNVGATWQSFHEKLEESRARTEASEEVFANGRSALMQWYEQQRIEASLARDRWKSEQSPDEAAERAAVTERYMHIAVRLAELSLDEVERMVLETIAARQAAESFASA